MPLVDAFGVKKKHQAMGNTWGHLYPEPGKYPATFIVSTGEGGATIMSAEYEHAGNPLDQWMYPQVLDSLKDIDTPAVYRIECELWFFKNCSDAYLGEDVGRPIKIKKRKEWKP